MRFCTNCGASVEENEKFCQNCGNAMPQPNQQQQYQQQPYQQQPYQQQYQQQPYQQRVQPNDKYQGYPMKWYKFLVYFALWASAVINCVTGIRLLTGIIYGSEKKAALVYRYIPGLRTGDIICGILILAIAVLAVFTAIKLLGLAAIGPKLLLALYASNLVIQLFYVVFVTIAAKDILKVSDMLTPSVIASIVVSIIMIIVNRIYFKNRESIFVN